jgi:hypothetical protein
MIAITKNSWFNVLVGYVRLSHAEWFIFQQSSLKDPFPVAVALALPDDLESFLGVKSYERPVMTI